MGDGVMDSVSTVEILEKHIHEIRQHLSSALPNEGCGIVAGLDQKSVHVFLTPNKLNSPTRYEVEPKALLDALQTMETNHWGFMAIFHSHPNGPDQLSATDFANHYYTDVVQMLFFPANGEWQHRAFLVEGNKSIEIPIKIVTI